MPPQGALPDSPTPPESLSILIPVFNESATVEEALRRLWAVDLPLATEIIAVNDCSTDDTADRLAGLAEESPWPFTLLHHERNRGKSAALRTALARASGSLTLICDADLEYDPADIPDLLAPVLAGTADAVYGSRFLNLERTESTWWHTLGNRLLTALSNLFSRLALTDMETCFKLVRTDVLHSLNLRAERFGFEPEVTIRLGQLGQRLVEIPIAYEARTYAEQKKIKWIDGFRALGTIMRTGLTRPK